MNIGLDVKRVLEIDVEPEEIPIPEVPDWASLLEQEKAWISATSQ